MIIYNQKKKHNSYFNNHLRQINSSEVPKNNYNLEGFKVFKQTQNIEPYKDSIKFKGKIYILVIFQTAN